MSYPCCPLNNNICMGCPGPQGPPGPPGRPGKPGRPGNFSDTATCGCVQQMRNVLEQLITLYPNTNFTFNLEDSGDTGGILNSLFPPPDSNVNAGILLVRRNGDTGLSLCKIASFSIPNETYDDSITFLPVPTPPPEGCDANCESAYRGWLNIGDSVLVAAGNASITGTIRKIEYGMIVVVQPNDLSPEFISLCKTEFVRKT